MTGLKVAVTGGAGRLGTRIAADLVEIGHDVRVLDQTPPGSTSVEFVKLDILSVVEVRRALRGRDVVVHLAGIHGAHLAAGVERSLLWRANVSGAGTVLAASELANVPRFVLASSTAVFGPGSTRGEAARVLDEAVPPQPDDVYDLTKLAAERAVRLSTRDGRIEGVCLRFGRFFFGSTNSYQLRKLSTGLDLHDAAAAVQLIVTTRKPLSEVYCVASDLPLPREERQALGFDVPGVLRRHLPALEGQLRRRGWSLPRRVGKSVDTTRIRTELGYQPTRDLAWWSAQLENGDVPLRTAAQQRRRHAAVAALAPLGPESF